MADVFTKLKRSEVMSRIRSRGNQNTELALMAFFRRHQITGWRRHREIRVAVSGARPFRVRPDFVFAQARLAVFVDGCFWHGCPQHATQPKGNAAFWQKKLSGNRTRDRLVSRTLRKSGWQVLRIWEHTLRWAIIKNPSRTSRRANNSRALTNAATKEARLLRDFQRRLAGPRDEKSKRRWNIED